MLIADLAGDALLEPGDTEMRQVLRDNRAMYHLGAVGPDLAFFAPDYGDSAVSLVRRVADLHDALVAPVVALYETYVAPVEAVLEEIQDGVQTVLDEVTCGLVGDIGEELAEVSDRISALQQQGLAAILVQAINVFDAMTPPIQDGEQINRWFWFDTLHNRRTGRFLDELWARATTDAQKAYVLGYASHYGGDLAGHEFVNTVVGSPARARLQRHHFAENMIDTHIFDLLKDAEITSSRMHLDLPHGQDVEREPSLRHVVDRLNDVPPDMREIFTMISQAMEGAFEDVPHPQRIASEYLMVDDLNVCFWLLLVTMRASTSSFIPPPRPLFGEALTAAGDAVRGFLETATDPPTPSVSSPDLCAALWSDDCDASVSALQDWAEAMSAALGYLAEVALWAAEVIRDLWQAMACTVTAPVKIGLQANFHIVHSALHAALERVREVLVQAAIVYPTRDFVRSHPVARQFLTVSRAQVAESGGGVYPHRAASTNAGFQRYPETPTEQPATRASAFPMGARAEQFIADFPVSGPDLRSLSDTETPQAGRELAAGLAGPLGSAVPYTVMVQRQLWSRSAGAVADLNLDSDRGVGHRNWLIAEGQEGAVAHDSTSPVDYDWAE